MSTTPGVTKRSAAAFLIRIAKLGVSIGYFLVSHGSFRLRRLLGKPTGGSGVVLYYHSVPRRYRQRFGDQMKSVATQVKPISVCEIDRLPAEDRFVAVTFDDGLATFVENAVPVLQELNIPATVFVVTDALGSKPAWGESYYDAEEQVMSEAQLRALPDSITVGSHTLTHPHLPTLNAQAASREITQPRQKLESIIGRPVTAFSFPYGEFSDSLVLQCSEAGYERVFTTVPTPINDHTDFLVGRVAADPWDWRIEFKLKILGAYCWQSSWQLAWRRMRQTLSRSPQNPKSDKTERLQTPGKTVEPHSAVRR